MKNAVTKCMSDGGRIIIIQSFVDTVYLWFYDNTDIFRYCTNYKKAHI